ncbi:MAG: hypothetical protein ACQKBU_09685, partial [Verrucomicrobiales bacterium]
PARPGGAPVVALTVEGGGHVTPSIEHRIPDTPFVIRLIGRQCHDLEGAEVAWNFLNQFSAPFSPKIAVTRNSNEPNLTPSYQVDFTGGYPAGHVVLETSPDLREGSWKAVASLDLDDHGAARLSWTATVESHGFIRARPMTTAPSEP